MREIKFRAWDEIEEKYNNDTDLIMTLNGDYHVDKGWAQIFPKLTLEQYTGLKDKNGKEIYEGDIIRCILGDKPVEFHDGRYWLGETLDDLFVANLRYDIEVIGNVHDNPELLQK